MATANHKTVTHLALVILCAISTAALLSLGASGCDPGSTGGDDSSELPDHLKNPEATAQAIAQSMESQYPQEEADLTDGLSADEGPEGSLFGVLLDDGNRIFITGEVDEESDLIVTGAVLEDADGELILKQEMDLQRERTTLIVASGDSMELYPETLNDGMFVEITLRGTEPPTKLVYILEEDGDARLIEAQSSFSPVPSETYAGQAVKLPRASKTISLLRSFDFDPTLLRDAVASADCPIIDTINNGLEDACTLWSAVNVNTSKSPAFSTACLSGNAFLETVRDGDPFETFDIPGLSTDPVAPEAVAKLKIGLNTLCISGELILSSGEGWLKFQTKAVDFACFAHTIINEHSRLIRGGGTIADRICRSLSGDILLPGCINTCAFSRNGVCDDGGPDSATSFCQVGTDCTDCGPRGEEDFENEEGCYNTCTLNFDGTCDDGGPGSSSDICALGTDCADCGRRETEEPSPACGADDTCNEACSIEDADPDCDGDDFCRIHDICCDGDGICDLVRCPNRTDDSDCTNLEWCDRLDLCCPDDDTCDTGCPTPDDDCGPSCDEDGQCAEDCPTHDPDCTVNAATSAVCPATIMIDTGVFDPNINDYTLKRFEGPDSEDDYSASCVYSREGSNGEWSLVMTWIPPHVNPSPSGACDSEEPGDRVFNGSVLESTVRHVEVVEVFSASSRLVDREDQLGELLDNLISAEVGEPCN